MRRLAVGAAVAMAAAAAGGVNQEDARPQRPRDPWVFRCVLDKQPRMVVIALHEHLWAAYDATDCTLYKVWDGDVKFTGAVYDYIHGPQPEVRGEVLLDHDDKAEWRLRAGGPSDEVVTATWRGYRFDGDRVFLQYELPGANGAPIQVSECPVATMDEDGTYVLTRTFETSNVPEGWVIDVALSTRQESDLHLTYASGGTVVPMNGANRAAGGPDYEALRFTLTANGTKSITARITNAQGGAR